MSPLETVELWRPRRDPAARARRALATLAVLALIASSAVAALMLDQPLLLPLGPAAALALVLAFGRRRPGPRGADGPPGWSVLLPRRWVPRVPGDRRAGSGPDRRGTGRRTSAAA